MSTGASTRDDRCGRRYSPLIHLAEIDALNLLTAIDELLIPETVYAELDEGGIPPEFSDLGWERIEVVEPVESSTELDAGERAALAVALERDDVVSRMAWEIQPFVATRDGRTMPTA